MTRVLVSDVREGDTELTLVGDNARYLSTVVRVRVGETIGLFDGRGGEWRGDVSRVERRAVVLSGVTAVTPLPEPRVSVTLAIGLLKGDQMDAVVRDATAMGVACITPLVTDHVVVPAKAWQSGTAVERWRRVAIAAAAQCGRATVPVITAPVRLADVLASGPGTTIVCLEPRGPATSGPDWRTLERPTRATLFVGPEGGWSNDESATFVAAAAAPLRLGPRTLRAELAPIAALATLWTMWE